jgi:hypothetical protein
VIPAHSQTLTSFAGMGKQQQRARKHC